MMKEAPSWPRCGRWQKMEKKLVDIQNGGLDLCDETGEAKMPHNEDKGPFAQRDGEFGGQGNVQ